MIRPIETYYNGYLFRSRLEARWAVFFDVAYIAYNYEPEGFILDDGTRYLPDFYLPDYGLFIEIKPHNRNDAEKHQEWEDKCYNFAVSTYNSILLCYGDPAEGIYRKLFTQFCDDSGGGTTWFPALFMQVDDNVVLNIKTPHKELLNINSSLIFCCDENGELDLWYDAMSQNCPWNTFKGDDVFTRAKLAARQERFERRR